MYLCNQQRIEDFLRAEKLDALLVEKDENVRYLSGFTGGESYLIFIGEERMLFTDSRYTEQARKEAPSFTIVNHEGKVASKIVELCDKGGVKRLGVEKGITYEFFLALKSEGMAFDCLICKPDILRQIKTNKELDYIKEACRIADEAFAKTIPYIKAGETEMHLKTILECAMLEGGSEGRSFDTIVASGWRSALPHGVASDKVIEEGDLITFDFGAIYQGYHSDMTRAVAVGTISDKLRFLYDKTLSCVEHVESLLCAGIKASDMDQEARMFLEKYELDSYFSHSLGHSVGLEVHESPTLSRRDDTILQLGMTETVEPGLYIPGIGGVRIEDTVVIEEGGIRILTAFPKDFISV